MAGVGGPGLGVVMDVLFFSLLDYIFP